MENQHQPAPGPDETNGKEFYLSLVRAIHEASPDGVLVVDDKGNIVSMNQRFLDVWQIPTDRVEGASSGFVMGIPDQPILTMAVERVKDSEGFLKRVQELYSDPNQDDYCEIELRDGRTLERHSTVLRGERGNYLGRVWFFRDVTERKQTEAVLMDLALRDPLTGVANRRHFFDRAGEEFTRARRYVRALSVLLLDIDHFKRINDRYGHAMGDQVLKTLCAGYKTQIRGIDLLARIGGEEFALLLPDTDLRGACVVAERLLQTTGRQNVPTDRDEIRWTISAGVAMVIPADTAIEDTLRRADRALYRAKENGRNRFEADT